MASSGRVLIAATITEVGNNSFLYPACQLCYSKLLTSVTEFFQCQKCNVTYYPVEAYYRYSLHATISDATSLVEVTSFGGMLDRFFGSTCSEFYHKYVLKLKEKYGQASDVILQTAVEKTFIGQNLIFGFKARLPKHNEIVTLKDICASEPAKHSGFPRTLPRLIAVQVLHQTNSTFTHTVLDHLQAILTKIEKYNLSENDCMGKSKLYSICNNRDIQPTGTILNADTLSGMCNSVSSSCSVIEEESSVALSCDSSLDDSNIRRNPENNAKSPNKKAVVGNKSKITPVKKLECLNGKSTNVLDNLNLLNNETVNVNNYSEAVILNQSVNCCSVEQYSSSRASFSGEEICIENVDPRKKDHVTWCVKSDQLRHKNLEKIKARCDKCTSQDSHLKAPGDRCTSKNSHLSANSKLEDRSLSERVEQTSQIKVNKSWSCYNSILNYNPTKEMVELQKNGGLKGVEEWQHNTAEETKLKSAVQNCEVILSHAAGNDSSQHLAEGNISTKGMKEILCRDPSMLDMPESEGLDTFFNASDVDISSPLACGVSRRSECVSQATQQPELVYDKKDEISDTTIDMISEDCDKDFSAINNVQFISSNVTLRRSRKSHSMKYTLSGLSDFEQLPDTSHEMSDYLLVPYKSLDTLHEPSDNVLAHDKSLDLTHELSNNVLVPDGSLDIAQDELLNQSCNTEADQSVTLVLPYSEDLSKFLSDMSKDGTSNRLTHNCSLSPAVGEKIASNKLGNGSVVKGCTETGLLLQTIFKLEDEDICSEDMFKSPVSSNTREKPKHLDTDVVTVDTNVVTVDTDVVIIDTDVVTVDDVKDHMCHLVESSNPGTSTCLKLPSCRQQDSLDHKLSHNQWQGPAMKQIFFHPNISSPVLTQHDPMSEYKNNFSSLQLCSDHQRELSENKTSESTNFNSSMGDVRKIIAESWLEENGHDSELGCSEDLFESQDNLKVEEEQCDKQGVNKCNNSYILKHTNSSVTKYKSNRIENPFKNTHLEPIDSEAKISAKKVRFTQTTEVCFNASAVIGDRPVASCAVNIRSCLKKHQTEKSKTDVEKCVSSWLSQDLFSNSCCEAPSPARCHRESTGTVLQPLSPSAISGSTVETSLKLNCNTPATQKPTCITEPNCNTPATQKPTCITKPNCNTPTTQKPTCITEPFCSTPLTHKPSCITNHSIPQTLHYKPTYMTEPYCSTPIRQRKPMNVDTSLDLFSQTLNSPVVGSCLSAHTPPTDFMTPDLFD